jgi:phosphoglycolate phosphatase
MKFKAVLFDLDGTLLDTLEDIGRSVNTVLTASGFPPHPIDAYRLFVGDGVERLVERALPRGQDDAERVAQLAGAVREVYRGSWKQHTCVYDGVPEVLDHLAGTGIPASVLSNKPDPFTREMVAYYFPGRDFHRVQGARPDVPRKPDPAAALDIARSMGRAPGDVLYVGDSNTDMRTAVAAGMFPAGARWGFRTADELRGSGAQALPERPRDLLGLLETGPGQAAP